MALSRGERLGPYEIVAPIGAGGMGEVYRARDTRLGRNVAIKVLPPEFADDPERLRRFEQEARAVAALSHPNVLALFDVGSAVVSLQGAEGPEAISAQTLGLPRPQSGLAVTEGAGGESEQVHFLVTELLEGESLRDRLRTGGLTLRKAVETAVQIAQGLAAAHEKGIVHRDLKPANVFITRDGHVKILDFGIAKLAAPRSLEELGRLTTAAEATEAGARLGTVGYMSPEQVRGQSVDHRTDIFSFGCVLYEMLSGRSPFLKETGADTASAILHEDPPPLAGGREIPSALQAIVNRCLEKRPEDRFSSAHDLGLALEAVSSGPVRTRRETVAPGADATTAATIGVSRLAFTLARLSSSVRARPWPWLLGTLAVLAALLVASCTVVRQRQVAWARSRALPELMRLVDAHEYWPAFLLARKIEAIVPDDATLQKLRTRFTGKFEREFRPAGAKVLARPRTGGDADWVELGEARGKPLPAPLGYSVFKVQFPGLEQREFGMTVTEFNYAGINSLGGVVALARRGEVPDGMVLVDNPAKDITSGLDPWLFDFAPQEHMAAFFVDTHEVTNREYKRFVDAGGYQRRDYWKEPFERDGKVLAWDEAMALFRDTTGRPAPATWEVGTYRPGTDDFPVTGVSWHEAAAYSEFAGKRLPSVYQWDLASNSFIGGDLVASSNFSGKLAPVGSYRGSLNIWGLYDVAGNAREWCSNASGGERFALGGAADGPAYMFWSPPVTKPPLDRNPMTGFRCIKPVARDAQQAQLDRPVARKPMIDWSKEKGFSDDAWKSWQGLLSYGKGPLDARTEWTDNTLPTWRMEKVSFNAAYPNERVVAYLFLPRNVPPPWQAVIFWPGGYAGMVPSSQDGRNTLDLSYWDYLVKDGRAVVYPILKDTFERGGRPDLVQDPSMAGCIPPVKDVFRTLDYLETRTDIRRDGIGYLGFSWGAVAGPMVLAVERRIKAAVFLGAGGVFDREIFGFCQHCSTPIQMINGRTDGFNVTHGPLFNALGTPADRKRRIVFEADHSLAGFEKDVIRINLEWFDRFLGPVR